MRYAVNHALALVGIVFSCLLLGTLLSPPDPLTCLLLQTAFSLIALSAYAIGVWIESRRPRPKNAAEGAHDASQ